ncbi:MAG: hypothetical protein U0176_15240 [Bacteroidia bacterium]
MRMRRLSPQSSGGSRFVPSPASKSAANPSEGAPEDKNAAKQQGEDATKKRPLRAAIGGCTRIPQ